jgi:uncharacterized protein YndB with AHSA1/START domain
VGSYSYEVNAESSAPPEVVFAVLADGARWREWAGPMIRHSSTEREGTPAPDGVGAIKKLGGWPVFSREETVEYDPPRRYAYTILSGPPTKNYKAIVELTPHAGGTAIHWTASCEPKIPGTGRFVRRFFKATISGVAKRLAEHAAVVHASGKRSTTS